MIEAKPPTQETISFDLFFRSQFWNTPPCVDIWIDRTKLASIAVDKDQNFSFNHICEFGTHQLRLVRHGKNKDETRIGPAGDYETQILELKNICIDHINVMNIVWPRCRFSPQYPEPWATEQKKQGRILESTVEGETIFGHDGIWTFEFQSPFYQFVVDCVKGRK